MYVSACEEEGAGGGGGREERSCWIDRMKRSAKEKRGCAIWMELSEREREEGEEEGGGRRIRVLE